MYINSSEDYKDTNFRKENLKMQTESHHSKITKVRFNIKYRNNNDLLWQNIHDLKKDRAINLFNSLKPEFDEVELYKLETTVIKSSMMVLKVEK